VTAAGGGAGPGAAGHGTGYEDAITRRIGGLETEARALRERVARAEATVEELARDNAALRRRAAAAVAQARRAGLHLALAAIAALVYLGALAFGMVRGGR